MIKLCVESTIFTFDESVYKHKFGVAMGSPLSPILANLCMEYIEEMYVKTLPDDIRAIFWVRYVDDVFIVYQHSEEKFSEFLNHINNIIPSIKFTVEYEENGKIPFLDVLVMHDAINHDFSFTVYRKPTNTEGYIHFFSRHADTVKRNVVSNMFNRALRICDPIYLDEEILHIKDSFTKLGYPLHFIEKCLSKARKQFYNPQPRQAKDLENNITLPFSKELDNIRSRTQQYNSACQDTKKTFSLTFRYNNTIRSKLINNSNRIADKTKGVYCVPCLDCSLCYLGETGRSIDIRLGEHRNACSRGDNNNAIATHSLGEDHRIGFSRANLVYNCNNIGIRKTVEGALISLNPTFKNNKSSTKVDCFTSYMICSSLKIKQFNNIVATLSPAASPLYSQVNELALRGPHDTGAYAALQRRPSRPDPLMPSSHDVLNDSKREGYLVHDTLDANLSSKTCDNP